MWHVETDFFALAVFCIMFWKERGQRRANGTTDAQGNAFYVVLIFSIFNDTIDILSSLAMNHATSWWAYESSMTMYVASMPLLAVVWVCYAYVLVHKDDPPQKQQRGILLLILPYLAYVVLALTNPITELFFHLSADVQYSRGIFFMPVGVGFIMLYSAAGLFMVLAHRKRIVPRSNAILLMAFFLTTAVFIWVQLANPGWLIINASYAVVYVWCDITVEEQRRRDLYSQINQKNIELEATAKKAASASQAKTEFLSRMSHDIRTPMNAIIGLTHLAQTEQDPETVQTYLHKIETSSDFLLGLINDILDMSKIENGELTLKQEPLTKAEFADSLRTVIQPLMDKRRLHFSVEMETDVECILVDRLRFNQIFFNLLSNSAKFTPEGGSVFLRSEKLPPNPDQPDRVGLRFLVRDTGIGMSQSFLQHLYDPFTQERSRLSDSRQGTGLGLPIVKSLVEAMGGTISVTSTLGQGTEFVLDFTLPLAEADAPEAAVQAHPDLLRGARILLVEDNDLNIYVAQIILEQMGCLVEVAKNGQEAVEQFAASPTGHFDAILMDVRMPVMNGIEATKAIRSLTRPDAKTVPILAMTADAFAEEQKRTLDAGMNYHLSKPIDPKLLHQALAEQLARTREAISASI